MGRGEQGVLSVEPYKSELLPLWRFKTPEMARKSSGDLYKKYLAFKKEGDFVGMDMARKFIQMGFTRSRRYANHASGRKYNSRHEVLPLRLDLDKALSAEIFKKVLEKIKKDSEYLDMKEAWLRWYG